MTNKVIALMSEAGGHVVSSTCAWPSHAHYFRHAGPLVRLGGGDTWPWEAQRQAAGLKH